MSCWSAIARAQTTSRKIYVANYASDSLGVFPINANGNLSSLTKFGVDNEIVAPSGVALDAKGKIYIANDGVATGHPESDSVRIYPAGSNAIAAPIGGGSNYSSPQAIAVGSDGTSYVVNGTGDISIFGPGPDGKLRMRTIVNGLDDPSGLAVDHDGNLYVVNGGSQKITVYGPDADGETPPIRTISGEKTRLNLPQGIALDTAGKIYVTNDGAGAGYSQSITIYPAGSSGDVAPIAVISGSRTDLQLPQGIAIDSDGKIYVANDGNLEDPAPDADRYDQRPRADPADSITVYAPGSSGDVAPIARINGPLTGLGHPMGIAVGP
jgi:sugar lactone lactonase YvrE